MHGTAPGATAGRPPAPPRRMRLLLLSLAVMLGVLWGPGVPGSCEPVAVAERAVADVAAVADCRPPEVRYGDMGNILDQDHQKEFLVLDKTCVDQETFIIYDPQVVAQHSGEEGLPNIDLGPAEYLYHHASAEAVAEALDRANHVEVVHHGLSQDESLVGSNLERPHLVVRLPAATELDAVPSEFSKCTVPIIMYTAWPNNLGEFFSRLPAFLMKLESDHYFDEGVTLVLATPEKLPLEPFNYMLLQPFTRYAPVSFPDFSSRLPSSFASNSTAEGRHLRCFEKLVVWRLVGGDYPAMVQAAQKIKQYYKDKTPEAGHVWNQTGPEVVNVLIEQRHESATRRFLELERLLEECGTEKQVPVGDTGRTVAVQCHAQVLGEDFVDDLSLMSGATVFVSFHGSGQHNVLFMEAGAALVEVRPRHAAMKHDKGTNWQRFSQEQNPRTLFWYGLHMENEALSPVHRLGGSSSGQGDAATADANITDGGAAPSAAQDQGGGSGSTETAHGWEHSVVLK